MARSQIARKKQYPRNVKVLAGEHPALFGMLACLTCGQQRPLSTSDAQIVCVAGEGWPLHCGSKMTLTSARPR